MRIWRWGALAVVAVVLACGENEDSDQSADSVTNDTASCQDASTFGALAQSCVASMGTNHPEVSRRVASNYCSCFFQKLSADNSCSDLIAGKASVDEMSRVGCECSPAVGLACVGETSKAGAETP